MDQPRPAIGFMRAYAALVPPSARQPMFLPVPEQPGRSVNSLRRLHALTGNNSGNFIHTGAMPGIVAHDPARSGMLIISSLVKAHGARAVAERLNAEMDALVFSCANLIRPGVALEPEMAVFRQLKVPLVVVGAGLQQPLEDGLASLSPSLRDFLALASSDGALFGVRGDSTAAFLHAQGLTGARSLGCPSFYAYPDNMLAVAPPRGGSLSLVTAGHIRARGGPGDRYGRLVRLIGRLPRVRQVSYVLQNELFFHQEPADDEPAYDPATGRLQPDWIARKFFGGARASDQPEFRYFTEPAAWRQFCAGSDLYLGDRIHGGVIAMQAGRPAIFVHDDERVRELADKLGAPSLASRDLDGQDGERLLEDLLSPERIAAMQARYRAGATEFLSAVQAAGLPLAAAHRQFLAAQQDRAGAAQAVSG